MKHSASALLLPVDNRFHALSCCRRMSTVMWMILFGVNRCWLPKVGFGGILYCLRLTLTVRLVVALLVFVFDNEASCSTLSMPN